MADGDGTCRIQAGAFVDAAAAGARRKPAAVRTSSKVASRDLSSWWIAAGRFTSALNNSTTRTEPTQRPYTFLKPRRKTRSAQLEWRRSDMVVRNGATHKQSSSRSASSWCENRLTGPHSSPSCRIVAIQAALDASRREVSEKYRVDGVVPLRSSSY